jgi:hypothetical protein
MFQHNRSRLSLISLILGIMASMGAAVFWLSALQEDIRWPSWLTVIGQWLWPMMFWAGFLAMFLGVVISHQAKLNRLPLGFWLGFFAFFTPAWIGLIGLLFSE